MNRESLERPFEAQLIKQRRGQGGKSLSYVEGAEYIKRLNEAFVGEWSFEVLEHHIHERDVIVLGKLTAGGIAKTAFGGSSITFNSSTGEALSLADDLKSAATDALKKASSLFGLGLHLYGGDPDQAPAQKSKPQASAPRTAASGPRAPSQGSPPGSSVATERQTNAILAISRTLGWDQDTLIHRCKDIFGVVPSELSRSDASTFIGELQQIVTKNA